MMHIQISNKLNRRICSMVNAVMYVRLMMGFYSKLQNSRVFTIIAKVYCLSFAMVLVYLFTVTQVVEMSNFTTNTGYILKMTYYTLVVIVSGVTDGEQLFDHIAELDKVDPMALVKINNYKLLPSLLVLSLVPILELYRFSLFVALQLDMSFIVTYIAMLLAIHLSHWTRILMLEIVWIWIKSLRKTMTNTLSYVDDSTSDASEGCVTLEIKTLEDYMMIYKRLALSVKSIGNGSKLLILMSLPNCLSIVLYIADIMSSKHLPSGVPSTLLIEMVLNILLPCIPAIFGELIKAEVEKIKICLTKQYRICNNDSLRKKIMDSIKFIELRPIKFSVWRLFSVDLSLPLALISICTTYAIVVLQFNKLKI